MQSKKSGKRPEEEENKVAVPKSASEPTVSTEKVPTRVDEKEAKEKTALQYAFYSVVAKEDSKVLMWTYKDMEALMSRSNDMRSALTRAMTSALVGKVVNFTISRSRGLPTWSTWLDDWKYSAGAKVQVVADQTGGDIQEEGAIKLPMNTLIKTKSDSRDS